jgi:CHAT domain-containing protein
LRQPLSLGQATNPTDDLLFSTVEALEVADTFESSFVQMSSRHEATVERMLELMAETDVFHFSGHAFYDPQEPFQSGLLCAPKNDRSEALTLGTIIERVSAIRSRFVVLSACETGQVELSDKLNDFLGLPGGFIVAGASTVLATLWRVDDLATALLLGKFFELWDDGRKSSAEALRGAQQWLRTEVTVEVVTEKLAMWLDQSLDINQELEVQHGMWAARLDRTAHPFQDELYWAPFYVTGYFTQPDRKEASASTRIPEKQTG